jgi:nucleotide-binding universal stress UspA family protein
MGRIVVGVDGSEGSQRALRWAAEEALIRAVPLEVVHTYDVRSTRTSLSPESPFGRDGWGGRPADVDATVQEAAQHAQELVDRLVEDLRGVEVHAEAVPSTDPARTLVERSRGADMLVVGSRGRGDVASLLLGSVSTSCAHHADCPVVIIRS